jgi:hypothetical protein
MKAKLKKMLGLAALGMTLSANTVPTWAGYVGHQEVSIRRVTTTYVTASGTMVGARYSADSRQFIGCSLNTTPYVQCTAQDSANNYAYCYSYDAGHVNQIQRMTDSSTVVFELNPSDLACSIIRIYNSSSTLK